MSEEYKAIKRLEEMTNNYSLNSEDLHYAIILYYLIINLQKENEELKLKLLEKKCSDKDVEYKEKIKLQNRITKAIEYIEWQKNNPQYDNVWRKYECESLIKILKGED